MEISRDFKINVPRKLNTRILFETRDLFSDRPRRLVANERTLKFLGQQLSVFISSRQYRVLLRVSIDRWR